MEEMRNTIRVLISSVKDKAINIEKVVQSVNLRYCKSIIIRSN